MKAPLRLFLALFTLAVPVLAQSPAKLKQELRTKEAAAKKDPDALFEAGQWAADKELANDAKRIFQAVLKLKPDHEGANHALGNELVEGKWLPAKEADALRKKAQAAEYAAKGYVEVAGIWVEPDHVDDAKRGVFHHDGEVVTKDEKVALMKGMVRHPETGELIEAKYLEQAGKRYFPISATRWVDEKEANQFHSDLKRPWLVRTTHCTILSTLPIAKIQEMRGEADLGVERVKPLLGGVLPSPGRRPVILIAATESEYRDLGNGLGDGTDACGSALVREEASMRIPDVGDVRGAICNNDKNWNLRYLRHAAAITCANGVAADQGITLPLWFLHGVGSYTSRFQTDADAGWFGKLHQQKGGVRNLKGFFSGFAINGEMESTAIDYNIYQAGLMFSFAASGGDEAVTAALQDIGNLLNGSSKGKADKAIGKFEAALIAAEPKIAAHLQELITKSP
ncbi:MAG: hypothetical protein JNM25_01780 [Planctomycetes bacterium]|nr:hypothetical protein [Planctomycetota bacterium]